MQATNKKIHFIYIAIILVVVGVCIYLGLTRVDSIIVHQIEDAMLLRIDFEKYKDLLIEDKNSEGRIIVSQGKKANETSVLFENSVFKAVVNSNPDNSMGYSILKNGYEIKSNVDPNGDSYIERQETLGDTVLLYDVLKDGAVKVKSVKKTEYPPELLLKLN